MSYGEAVICEIRKGMKKEKHNKKRGCFKQPLSLCI